MDVARRGVRLGPRGGRTRRGREDEVARRVQHQRRRRHAATAARPIRLLPRAFEDEPPDLILLETLSLVRSSTYATVEALLDTGLPVWLSFRRCRHGVCGVYGQHWGGPEGDAFGRAARRFEEMGVGALLINCLPPDHVTGMLSWLRDFTDLPLGVYPNLGYCTADGWRFEPSVGGDEYAELAAALARGGRADHRRLLRRRPEHIAAARARAARHAARSRPARALAPTRRRARALDRRRRRAAPWTRRARPPRCTRSTSPSIVCEPGVFVPDPGQLPDLEVPLPRGGSARDQRCLDIGCGTGLLTVQLALNGAAHVHAIDIDRRAVANTLTNAFRNGVADRVTRRGVDLYPWVPEGALRRDRREPLPDAGRPVRAGRHPPPARLLGPQPARPPDRAAARGARRRRRRLRHAALDPRPAAHRRSCSPSAASGARRRLRVLRVPRAVQRQRKSQIERVEELSDAYHLRFGDDGRDGRLPARGHP